jgi:hypothetical protein
MLPPKVREYAERAVAALSNESNGALDHELARIDGECNVKGAFHSGGRIRLLLQATYTATAKLGGNIWTCVREAYEASIGLPDESHRLDLKQLCEEFFTQSDSALSKIVTAHVNLARTNGSIDALLVGDLAKSASHVLGKLHLAIDLYMESRLQRGAHPTTTSGNTTIVHGSVGVLQTGAGAVANVAGGIHQDQRIAMLDALSEAAGVIIRAPAGSVDFSEMMRIVAESADSLNSPAPDKPRLRAAFDVLASTVQAIGSAPAVYAALQSMAKLL